MQCYCAPMEGITGRQFRLAHNRWFGGIDRYYIPFLSPTQTHVFSKKEWQEVLPENNQGITVVPQLLTRNSENFIWGAQELAAIGYQEVNLNLGCPSGTVVAKGKGSGFLAHPQELDEFLSQIFDRCPINISVKTRLGLNSPHEFERLLGIFQKYPIKELIIHPRIQKDFYKYPVRRDVFSEFVPHYTVPICFNGDLYASEQCRTFFDEFPSVQSIMLGRGLIGDPALARKAQGGKPADTESLSQFHNELYENYCISFNSRKNAMMRMKELWFYLIELFDDNEKLHKAMRKATDPSVFDACVNEIFRSLPLRSSYCGPNS